MSRVVANPKIFLRVWGNGAARNFSFALGGNGMIPKEYDRLHMKFHDMDEFQAMWEMAHWPDHEAALNIDGKNAGPSGFLSDFGWRTGSPDNLNHGLATLYVRESS